MTDSRIVYLFYFLVSNSFLPWSHKGTKARRNTKKIKKISLCSFEPPSLCSYLFFSTEHRKGVVNINFSGSIDLKVSMIFYSLLSF